MEKKQDFDAFEQAIESKNLQSLRNMVTVWVKLDPYFSTGEYASMMKRIEDHGIDITVPYEEQPVEKRYRERGFPTNRELWTEDYFFHLVEWLRKNFAPEARLPHIKEVGRAVRKPLENFQQAPQAPESQPASRTSSRQSRQTQPPKSGWSSKQIAAVIAAVAAVIALVALIFKLLK